VSKAPSPLLGFNNNIKHKGRVFHVQTEDSGIRHPHIITHLFMDGGRILKTVKTSYAEHLADEKMGEIVRKMMKDQHKAMFMALRDGAFDAQINHITPGLGVAPGDPAAVPPATPSAAIEAPPASIAQPEPPRASPMVAAPPVAEPPPSRSVPFVPEPMPRPPALPAEATAVAAQVPVSLPRVPTSPGQVFVRRTPSVMLAPGVEARPAELPVEGSWGDEPAPRYSRTPSPVSTPRATTEPPAVPPSQPPRASRPPSITPFPASDLPPPPAAVLGKHRPQGGAYSEVSALAKPSGPEKHSSGRYLASRPTSQAATSRPPDGRSLFGDDLISEKSLDEVILSYLAEDLDTPPPKK
jgi:hypothetical protein